MAITFDLHATTEQITLQAPQHNFTLHLPNVVAIDPTTKKIMEIGRTEAEFQKTLGDKWEVEKTKLIFIPAFSASSPFPEADELVLNYYGYRLLQETRKRTWFIWLPLYRFDYALHLPEYDRFSPARQKEFEYGVQTRLRARQFLINGKPAGIPQAQRRFERLIRLVFLDVLPLAILLSGLGLSSSDSNGKAILILGVSLLATLATALIGKIIWLFATRPFLPRSYLRFVLSQRHLSLLSFGDSFLSKHFLQDATV